MSTADPRLTFFLDGIHFGEGPRWHEGRLFLSDIAGGRVLEVDAEGKATTVVTVDGRPSGLGWLPDGRLLVVSMQDHRLLRLDGRALTVVAELAHLCGGHANDMVVDAEGRAYISNIGFDKIVVWDGGGKDGGEGATAGFLQSLAGSLPPMMHMMRDIGGVEMPEFFGKLVEESESTKGKGKGKASTGATPPSAEAEGEAKA